MIKSSIALALAGVIVFVAAACAQTISVPAASTLPAAACQGSPPGPVSWNGTAFVCVPWPAATGGVAWGPPVTISTWPHPLVAADANHTLIANSPVAVQIQVPAPTGLGTSFISCFINYGAGPVSFVAANGVTFKGGATQVNHDENACLQPDDKGNWSIMSGGSSLAIGPSVSGAVANPNLAQ